MMASRTVNTVSSRCISISESANGMISSAESRDGGTTDGCANDIRPPLPLSVELNEGEDVPCRDVNPVRPAVGEVGEVGEAGAYARLVCLWWRFATWRR